MEGGKKAASCHTWWTPRAKCIVGGVWSGGSGDVSRWSKCERLVGEVLSMRPRWASWELSRSYHSVCVAVYECCPCLGNTCIEKYKTSLISDIQSSGPCFSVYWLFYLLHIRASKETLHIQDSPSKLMYLVKNRSYTEVFQSLFVRLGKYCSPNFLLRCSGLLNPVCFKYRSDRSLL